jgi:hypothetical protein
VKPVRVRAAPVNTNSREAAWQEKRVASLMAADRVRAALQHAPGPSNVPDASAMVTSTSSDMLLTYCTAAWKLGATTPPRPSSHTDGPSPLELELELALSNSLLAIVVACPGNTHTTTGSKGSGPANARPPSRSSCCPRTLGTSLGVPMGGDAGAGRINPPVLSVVCGPWCLGCFPRWQRLAGAPHPHPPRPSQQKQPPPPRTQTICEGRARLRGPGLDPGALHAHPLPLRWCAHHPAQKNEKRG